MKRFRDPALRRDYEMALTAYRTKDRDIWRPPGTLPAHRPSNAMAKAFWRGFDGFEPQWTAASKRSHAYAFWRAGQDARRYEDAGCYG